jgi:hypothetical protein
MSRIPDPKESEPKTVYNPSFVEAGDVPVMFLMSLTRGTEDGPFLGIPENAKELG